MGIPGGLAGAVLKVGHKSCPRFDGPDVRKSAPLRNCMNIVQNRQNLGWWGDASP